MDYTMTIDSDDEKTESVVVEEAEINQDFSFDVSGDPLADLFIQEDETRDLVQSTKPVRK